MISKRKCDQGKYELQDNQVQLPNMKSFQLEFFDVNFDYR